MSNEKNYLISDQDSKIISVLKAILTIMIVMIHTHYNGINLATGNSVFELPKWFEILKKILSDVLPTCAVPGFFVISGVLLYKKPIDWKDNILKKIRSLLVPYFIINTFWIVFYACVQLSPSLKVFFSNPDKIVADWGLLEYLDAYLGFGTSNAVHLIYGPLWFVRNLFVLNIFAPVIKKIIDKAPVLTAAALLVLIVASWFIKGSSYTVTSIVYFAAGYYLVKYDIHFRDINKVNKPAVAAVYVSLIPLFFLSKGLFVHKVIKLLVIWVGLVFWTLASATVISFRGGLLKLLELVYRYSFPIYIFHQIPTTILEKILITLFPETVLFMVLGYFATAIMILCYCIGLSMALERWTPGIYGLLTGGRKKAKK
ncbi:acyltransferase family protein [Butyrivibrio sp. MC2013]|uniref:acyltransferase family protein n=1 Tax=Butyrivibrio sp. MC2013 TaxID=1280686 RepID=UPI00040E2C00|nr:acyltransferase [Butyrivibrio sp. MC2013]